MSPWGLRITARWRHVGALKGSCEFVTESIRDDKRTDRSHLDEGGTTGWSVDEYSSSKNRVQFDAKTAYLYAFKKIRYKPIILIPDHTPFKA